jgi:hypothetical protein
MKNPYIILQVSQDTQKAEIMKAQMEAMKRKEYSLQEIAVAAKQLLDPAKRLAADFMYPSKLKVKRILPIQSNLVKTQINLSAFDEDVFDSLQKNSSL